MQLGSEGPNRRPHTYMLTSPLSHARSYLERKSALIIKMSISNQTPINTLHDSTLHLWQRWPNCRKYWASSSNLSPTGADQKNIYKPKTRGVSPRTQIKSDYSGEYLKRKPLTNPSQLISILILNVIISIHKLGLKVKKIVWIEDKKTHLRGTRHAPSSPTSPR